MATNREYELRIRQYTDSQSLLDLWYTSREGQVPAWDPGRAFEYSIIRSFELEGVRVRYPFEVRGESGVVEQIDGVIHLPDFSALVESKDFRTPLGIEPIAKLRLRLERRPAAAIGVVFAANGMTDPALEIAKLGSPRNILIWQNDEIPEAMARKQMVFGMRKKYDYAVELGMPYYNLLDLDPEDWP